MADPTELNGQITDAVTQAHVLTLGSAPSTALGQLYQSAAQALGIAAHNAVAGQQATALLAQAIVASLVRELSVKPPAPPITGL